ncbi:hypothetical protein WN51_10917 [Melipona quadrifasciata]|uniref:Uncharacterized protein n=1 Tax=Melipona quadrifasciata TaxID=166423 RepID=A0A0N0BI75_9HYME|nr:hypothetical protein WN51_10917 [Melipona quadrifasciata]
MRNWSMPFLISICIIVFVVHDAVPDKWRNVSPDQKPQIELRLYKSHTYKGKNWTISVEYIISPNNNVKSDRKIPNFLSGVIEHSLINPRPYKCPSGQKKNSAKQCKVKI